MAGPAFAQGRARLRHDGRRRASRMLIGNESVQKELKLDDTQVAKAKELAEKTREKMTAAREETKDLDQEERTNEDAGAQQRDERIDAQGGRRVPQARADHPAQADLLPGPRCMAFTDPEVAKKLNITDAQKDEIKTIVDESNAAMREIVPGLPGRSRRDHEEDRRAPQGDPDQGRRQAQRRTAENLERDDRLSVRAQDDVPPSQQLIRVAAALSGMRSRYGFSLVAGGEAA